MPVMSGDRVRLSAAEAQALSEEVLQRVRHLDLGQIQLLDCLHPDLNDDLRSVLDLAWLCGTGSSSSTRQGPSTRIIAEKSAFCCKI